MLNDMGDAWAQSDPTDYDDDDNAAHLNEIETGIKTAVKKCCYNRGDPFRADPWIQKYKNKLDEWRNAEAARHVEAANPYEGSSMEEHQAEFERLFPNRNVITGGSKARKSKARRSKARRSKARKSKAHRSKARRSKAHRSKARRSGARKPKARRSGTKRQRGGDCGCTKGA